MQFKYNFKINFISIIVSGFLGIIAAYNNLGVWSLIIQQITKAIISGVMLWICIRWIPIMTFSFNSIRILFKYGVKIFLAGLFDTLYNNVYVIIIGKLYDLDTLAFYNRGNHLPQLGMNTVNSVFASVLFPAFSIIQDDKKQIYKLTKKFIKTSMFIILPILALMIIFADKIILILLGDKWLPSAIFLRLSCLIYLFWPLHTINLKILLACGRSDYFLLVEIIKKIQILLMIILTYRYGVLAMLWGSVVLAPISFIENSWANIKLIDYSPIEQIKDILPSVIITLIASIVVYYISPIFESTYILIFSSTILFIIIYLFLSAVFHVMPEAISHYLYKNF